MACQGQLRQWGIVFSSYATEHNERLFANNTDPATQASLPEADKWGIPDQDYVRAYNPYFDQYYKMLVCPAAARLREETQELVSPDEYDPFRRYGGDVQALPGDQALELEDVVRGIDLSRQLRPERVVD